MTSENHDSTEELGCVSRLLQESRYLAPKQNNLRVKKPETEPEEARKKKKGPCSAFACRKQSMHQEINCN